MVAQRCDFAIGETIDGRYQVKKTLGEGAFGKVFSVTEPNGTTLALKLLKLWTVPSEIRDALLQRFDMEFRTGQIESKYLVHSLAHGFEAGNPYIVMEFCPGGDLNSARLDQLDFTKVATHVLTGLKALHSCGKVHRDLKPENVLLKANGDYALTDFGISGDRNKRMTERNILGRPQQIFGTYPYMPPEQLKPHKDATVLPTTDIFSFGVMMFQLLTGELPFGRLENERDLVPYLKRGKAGDWNAPLLSQSTGTAKWTTLIRGCLQPDFQKRLQTTDDALALVPQVQRMHGTVVDCGIDYQTRIVNGVLLRIMQGEEYGKVYRLDDMLRGEQAILRMGRMDHGVNNDIAIVENDSCYISRRHCTLELDYELGTWVIRDGQWVGGYTGNPGAWHESTNGTYVNSRQVDSFQGMPFAPGDIISIGDTKLRAEGY